MIPPSNPIISIANAPSVNEPTTGNTATLVFPVTISSGSFEDPTTVSYTTPNVVGDAGPNADYTPISGTLTFSPGQTSASLNVTVLSDTVYNPNAIVTMDLSSPVGATLSTSTATGTIVDAPKLYH